VELLIQFGSYKVERRIVLALALVALACAHLSAQVPNEYEVKAAFLVKFASFVEWPEGAGAPGAGHRCIGVVGQDPFGQVLDDVVARKFVVRRFRSDQEPVGCEIVFVGASERKRLGSLLEHLHHSAVLTVSDMPGFCEQGGMINLTLGNNRIGLEINPEAAAESRLQLSSKLLGVARIVRQPVQGSR